MTIAKVTVDAAVICDDVRREITNREILIGVWPLEFALPNYPFDLDFIVHCEGAVLSSGLIHPRMKVIDEIGSILYNSDLSNKAESGQFVKGRYGYDFSVSLKLTRDCMLSFYISFGDGDILACQRRVILMEQVKKERDIEMQFLSLLAPSS